MTYIVLFCAGIVSFTFMFPTLTVNLLFGEAYISISPMLGWYALATAFFAMSNVFTYYFLSLDKFVPIMLSGVFGVLQIGLIIVFHHTLFEVVMMQVIAMAILLIAQLVYYQYRIKSTSKLA
jgi:O-antigen/teichoic acid export membrane protein